MTKRFFVIAFATALLASVTFAAPSHAGSTTVLVEANLLTIASGSVSDFDITMNVSINAGSFMQLMPAGSVTVTGETYLPVAGPPFDEINVQFNPVLPSQTPKFLYFTFTTNDPIPVGGVNYTSYTWSGAGANGVGNSVFVSSVPEPASMALLGIGVAGMLAMRRMRAKRKASA
jgi:hypothetical protein